MGPTGHEAGVLPKGDLSGSQNFLREDRASFKSAQSGKELDAKIVGWKITNIFKHHAALYLHNTAIYLHNTAIYLHNTSILYIYESNLFINQI